MAETGRNADALEQEIERTRDELARTVDNIADRVAPQNVARRTVQQVRDDANAARTLLPGSRRAPGSQASLTEGGDEPAQTSGQGKLVAAGETLAMNRVAVLAGVGVVLVATVVAWRRARK